MTRHGPGYPITLDVAGRLAVVVGGGVVATRRARALADAGALVHVVAPRVSTELEGLERQGLGLVLHRRPYAPGDLAGAWLAHAATDDSAVNAAVAAEACELRICACARTTPGRRRRAPRPWHEPGTSPSR